MKLGDYVVIRDTNSELDGAKAKIVGLVEAYNDVAYWIIWIFNWKKYPTLKDRGECISMSSACLEKSVGEPA